MSTEERRAPGTSRMPFDALVEVGGDLGPTFEAQAVNISEDGIQLRTAYLPEPGQALTCRFDSGPTRTVLAAGEVVWAQGSDRGGEFAVRFTDVDAEGVETIKGICGVPGHAVPAPAGSKVRLHIDGLASPMRAKIKESKAGAVTVGSELGFLQVGRPLELEDAESGKKRPASIDRVDVVVDAESNVPQLVVTLRYSDMASTVQPEADASEESVAEPSIPVDVRDLASPTAMDASVAEMKGWVARGIERAGQAVGQFADRAKTTITILRKQEGRADDAPRRTTAPPPNGGLHATGRRVVREPSSPAHEAPVAMPKAPNMQRRAVLAGGIMAVAILGALALKKGHHDAPQASAVSADAPASAAPANASPPAEPAAPPSATVAAVAPVAPPEPPAASSTPAPAASPEYADNGADTKEPTKKRIHVPPFSNGPVHHGNILRLKMDGPIEAIEGAQQPTGFTVKVPGHRSLEAAAPLAARDARIAAIKVSNDAAGAELTVAFKDGVPNYRVSAKGEDLIIALAPAAPMDETLAKKDEKGSKSPKHRKHSHVTGASSSDQDL